MKEILRCKTFIKSLTLDKSWNDSNSPKKVKVSFSDLRETPWLAVIDGDENIYVTEDGYRFKIIDPENIHVKYFTWAEA